MGTVVESAAASARSRCWVTDPDHAVPVQIARSGLRTIAYGHRPHDRLLLPNIPQPADVKVGDVLITSGIGGRFPAGFPWRRSTKVEPGPVAPVRRRRWRCRAATWTEATKCLLIGNLPPALDVGPRHRKECTIPAPRKPPPPRLPPPRPAPRRPRRSRRSLAKAKPPANAAPKPAERSHDRTPTPGGVRQLRLRAAVRDPSLAPRWSARHGTGCVAMLLALLDHGSAEQGRHGHRLPDRAGGRPAAGFVCSASRRCAWWSIAFLVQQIPRAACAFSRSGRQAGAIGLLLLNDRVILRARALGGRRARRRLDEWFGWLLGMVLWPWLYVHLAHGAATRSRERGLSPCAPARRGKRHLIKNPSAEADQFHAARGRSVLGIVLLIGGLCFGGYFRLHVLPAPGITRPLGSERDQAAAGEVPARGLIYDRKGRLLADNVPAYRLEVCRTRPRTFKLTMVELNKLSSRTPEELQAFEANPRRSAASGRWC
jgi:hypothetical protein